MYKTFEGFTKFSVFEGLDPNVVSEIKTKIGVGEGLKSDVNIKSDKIIKNNQEISSNIQSYNNTIDNLKSKNNIYHYNDTLDSHTIVGYNTPKDIKSAINNDVNELRLYQNSIYITGIIACSTLLISAILISKK
jgi:hypothetical protein